MNILKKKEAKKRAQEFARYLLPVGMNAHLYHTVNVITALRYINAVKVIPEAKDEAKEFIIEVCQAIAKNGKLKEIKNNLKNYKGIKKRFDILQNYDNFVLIDDYGHHPTEIKATFESVKEYANLKGFDKITAIWQPHKYSRTIDNLEEFIKCFDGADELIILPVWAASETPRDINFKEKFKQALISTVKVISDDYKPNIGKKNASSKNLNFFELDNLKSRHDFIRLRAETDSEALKKKFSNKDSSSDLVKKNRVTPLLSNALSDILFPKS